MREKNSNIVIIKAGKGWNKTNRKPLKRQVAQRKIAEKSDGKNIKCNNLLKYTTKKPKNTRNAQRIYMEMKKQKKREENEQKNEY